MASARFTTDQAHLFLRSRTAEALRVEAERWHDFLQQRFEEAERRPKYHRMLGEAYGRLTVSLDHGDIAEASSQLDWMRAEGQFFANHSDFPIAPAA